MKWRLLLVGCIGCTHQPRVTAMPSPVVAPTGCTADPMPPEELASLPYDPSIRVVSAPKIREVSMAQPVEAPPEEHELAAPHRSPPGLPAPSTVADLRTLVGHEVGAVDLHDPVALALAWSRALGGSFDASSGPRLVAWAKKAQHLVAPDDIAPGDLVVFDHTDGDDGADLVGIAVERDARGVIEFVYLGGSIVRRGFVDPARPDLARDGLGRVVNTYLRHGRRPPPAGTRYLAGELLAHVVRVR